MFEKDAEDNKPSYAFCAYNTKCELWKSGFQQGAEFGYNKAKVEVEDSYRESLCNLELNLASITEQLEELEKSNEWHYVKDGLPKTSGRYLVYTGGEPFFLDFDTEVNSFGYWVVSLGDDWGVQDEDFETVKDRGEDDVIAWKEIVLPNEVKEND